MRVERLDDHHDLGQFRCGIKSLDDWLTRHARENDQRGLSRVYVLVTDTGEVVGYFSVTMASVNKRELPSRLGRGLPNTIEIGAPLLGRLAVATEYQGQGLGLDLLVAAVERIANAAESVAVRSIAVDPVDETARSFYRRWGFADVPGDDGGRMYIGLDEVVKALLDDRD